MESLHHYQIVTDSQGKVINPDLKLLSVNRTVSVFSWHLFFAPFQVLIFIDLYCFANAANGDIPSRSRVC